MTQLNPQAITAAVYARIKSELGGAAVRAQLGAGAASVLPASGLRSNALPARPLVALRPGVIAGESLEMREHIFTWWLYDEPAQNGWRISGLLPLLEGAYPQLSIPYGRVKVTGIGQETIDDALGGLIARSLQLTYTRRA
jgi:hypothetical protein